MPRQTVSQVFLERVRSGFGARSLGERAVFDIWLFCKRAEQAVFLEEGVECTALKSLLSTKLNRRALNEPLLPQRASEVPILAARTSHESESRSISFFGRIWPLYRGV